MIEFFLAVRCKRPIQLMSFRNGYFTIDNEKLEFGTTITFFCNENYELTKADAITCNEFGKWLPRRLPRCRSRQTCVNRNELFTVKSLLSSLISLCVAGLKLPVFRNNSSCRLIVRYRKEATLVFCLAILQQMNSKALFISLSLLPPKHKSPTQSKHLHSPNTITESNKVLNLPSIKIFPAKAFL